jgi:hypothetical protein
MGFRLIRFKVFLDAQHDLGALVVALPIHRHRLDMQQVEMLIIYH